MLRHLSLFTLFLLLTGLGLAGGWFAARQAGDGSHAGEHHEETAKAPAASGALDQRTLENLGVRIEPVHVGPFTHSRDVQAVIEDRPRNSQPVVAPLGGIVTVVHVEVGGVVEAGASLVTLVRDPIARPKPELTADILTPISEDVHGAVSKLRSGLGRVTIVDANLERIRKSRGPDSGDGVPVLRRSEIDFENERARLLVEIEDARRELERHGLDEKEIAAVEAGKPAPPNRHLWEHALRHGGLWTEGADRIRAQLPAADRALPWCTVALGELSAAGLATDELAKALELEPAMAAHFAEAAGLLLRGTPLGTVQFLAAQGALAPEIVVRAPPGIDRWDVVDVEVRPGQRLEAGAAIGTLHDARTMWLRLEPVGEEIGLVSQALEAHASMQAVPLVKGAGPVLEDVVLGWIATRSAAGHHAGHAYADVRNEPLGPSGAATIRSRSWALRAGTRYLVKVPVDRIGKCFVLPAGALASKGADRVVFLRDGTTFRPQVVRVLYEDDAVAVLPVTGGLFDGDVIAVSGAFALKLALQLDAGSGAVDPHAGHNHN